MDPDVRSLLVGTAPVKHDAAQRPTHWPAALGWALLLALLLAQAPLQVLVIDSGRDLAWALAIVRGEQFPQLGPELNGIWHLGPIWYYLLAVLLAVSGSITGVGVLLAALAASKLWFGYRLGDELGGRATGLACAALIALPGWASVGQIVLNHTALVEAGSAATLWLALRGWRDGRRTTAVLASAAAALTLHAHPTAAVLLPFAAATVLRTSLRQRAPAVAVLAAMAFALPFLPMLLAEALAGWPQLAASRDYAAGSPLARRLAATPDLLWGLSFGQAEWVRHYLFADSIVGRLWQGLYLAGLAVAALGVLRRLRGPGPVRWLLPTALAAAVAIGLLRDAAPAWMFHSLTPFTAVLGAIGLAAWLPPQRQQTLAHALLLLAIATNALLLLQRDRIVAEGLAPQGTLTLADVHRRQPALPASFWLPLHAHEPLSRQLCEAGDTALHGELATAYHFGQGVAATLACRDRRAIRLGGRSARRHLLGLPRAVADALELEGSATAWGFVLIDTVEVLHPDDPVVPTPHTRYLRNDYVDLIATGVTARRTLTTACAAGDLLLINNLVPLLNVGGSRVLQDGVAIDPVLRTLAGDYYRCNGDARLQIEIEAVDIAALQVLRVPARRG